MNCIENPHAFPRPASRGKNHLTGEEDVIVDPQQGMTLLDYFASHAIQGLASEASLSSAPANKLAIHAYNIAEAMILEKRRRCS